MPNTLDYLPVPFFKRLISILYDLILLIAVCFAVAAIMSIVTTFLFNDGNAITEVHPLYMLNQFIMLFTIFMTSMSFLIWFWHRGGQTLGMKTWRLKLVSDSGEAISWKQAIIRFFAATLSWGFFGLGFLWCLIDDKNRGWHDILSSTHLVQLEKK